MNFKNYRQFSDKSLIAIKDGGLTVSGSTLLGQESICKHASIHSHFTPQYKQMLKN